MRYVLAALFPLLISCATLQKTQTQLEFETTNSPCIDAMMINMISTGCKNISLIMGGSEDMHYSCDDATAEASSWNDATFFAISHKNYQSSGFADQMNGVFPFCKDIHVVMFIED